MISSRYALPVAVLLLIALIPTIIHNYISPVADDGKSVRLISPVLIGFSSEPFLRHNDRWVKTLFGSEDWIERIYKDPKGNELKVFAARSYDYKKLYHHPELALSHGIELIDVGGITIPGEPEIPVHLLRSASGDGSAAYVLLYEGEFIKDPVLHQFTESIKQMVSSRKVMTLFYISDTTSSADDEYSQSPSASILAAVIQSFIENKVINIED